MEPVGALREYFSGSRLALAQSCSRRHHVELASGCGSYRLIARGDCAEIPYFFAEEGDGGVRMFSRAAYQGMATSCARRRRHDRCVRVQQTR